MSPTHGAWAQSVYRSEITRQEALKTREKLNFLKTVKIFEKVSESNLEKLAGGIYTVRFDANQVIFKEGDVGDCFYAIVKGKVKVSISTFLRGARDVTRLAAGKYFGELALIDSSLRKATITTVDPTECWVIDKQSFVCILGNLKLAEDESLAMDCLRKVKILDSLDERQKVSEHMSTHSNTPHYAA